MRGLLSKFFHKDRIFYYNIIVIGSIVIIFILLPHLVSSYLLYVLTLIFLYAYLSVSWNILGGYAGQLSLGHALFLGIGAYTSSLLYLRFNLTPWLGMFVSGICGAFMGLFIEFLSFRYALRGPYFTMVTIAFAEIFRLIARNIKLTNGSEGLSIPPLREPAPIFFQFTTKTPFYYIAFVMLCVLLMVVYFLKKSRFGFYLTAIREDETAAEAVGVNIQKYKILASTLSAFLTALGGTFYAQFYQYIHPDSVLSVGLSVDLVIRSMIGGKGTLFGPVLGSVILTPIAELTRSLVTQGANGLHLIIYAVLLMLICLVMPRGLIPWLSKHSGQLHGWHRRIYIKYFSNQ